MVILNSETIMDKNFMIAKHRQLNPWRTEKEPILLTERDSGKV